VDDYHGMLVADPYRWLEDTEAEATQHWIAAQNEVTFGFLDSLSEREEIRQRLTTLWNFPKMPYIVHESGRYFQLRNNGLQNQNVLVVAEALDAEPRILLDPNTLSADGTVALTNWVVSPDGRWLAYATSARGSDWMSWRVRNVDSGIDLPDLVEWSKFAGASWLSDSSGFYYARYDAPVDGLDYRGVNYFHKLYFHRLETAQTQDRLVYERPDHKEWGFGGYVTEDGRYLIIHVWIGTDARNLLFYQDLQQGQQGGPVRELIADLEASYRFVGNDGPLFYLQTNLDAPRGRLIAIDTAQPERPQWRTLIDQGEDVLQGVGLVHNEFVALYLHDAHHQIQRFDLAGNPIGEIALPTLGTANLLLGRGSRYANALFYTFASFAWPQTIYRYDFQQQQSTLIFSPTIQFDFTPYVTRQHFVTSKDGTRVPLFLVHHQDALQDGAAPTLLYGYGGFDIAMLPFFSISNLVWLERGGVLAVACLRGGGEYGEEWHKAGMLHNKQNVFDDFIACAEHLIAEQITVPARLAIAGGSNGGLLVGACVNQRPELFAAAIPRVGVMDMLRYHQFTIGWAWVSEFGSPDDPEQFKTLYAYSPLHNLKPGQAYPAILITTGDHDDRVVPGHSFKYAAALQAAQGGTRPTLIRIQTQTGHGMGKPTTLVIAEEADVWAFLNEMLD
jgi:prolyl oligopeptidase